MIITLVGSKCDLARKREVSTEEGQQFAKEHGLLFIEASAKTCLNVDQAFIMTATNILPNINLISKGVLDLTNNESSTRPQVQSASARFGGCCNIMYMKHIDSGLLYYLQPDQTQVKSDKLLILPDLASDILKASTTQQLPQMLEVIHKLLIPPNYMLRTAMEEWVIGAFINIFSSLAINFGTNLLKLGHTERERHSTIDGDGKTSLKPITHFQTWRYGCLSLQIVLTASASEFQDPSSDRLG
ncbi:hypothetical protein ACFE04_004626 [Oxalis oulophora]